MSGFSATDRNAIRANARQFLDHEAGSDLPAQLRDALMHDGRLRQWAATLTAEKLIATRDLWAKEIGAVFAETVRDAFRRSEAMARDERRDEGVPA